MNRLLVAVFVAFLLLLASGVVVVGLFPPHAHREHIEHAVPLDHLPAH